MTQSYQIGCDTISVDWRFGNRGAEWCMTSRDIGSNHWYDDGNLNTVGLAMILAHFGLEDDDLSLDEVRYMSPSALQARRVLRERADSSLAQLVAISEQPGHHVEARCVG